MSDILPNFEQKDREGSSDPYQANATSSYVAYPSVSGTCIAEFYIQNMDEEEDILLSLDGVNLFKTIKAECWLGWSLKGNHTQVYVKRAGTVDAPFELILNRDLD